MVENAGEMLDDLDTTNGRNEDFVTLRAAIDDDLRDFCVLVENCDSRGVHCERSSPRSSDRAEHLMPVAPTLVAVSFWNVAEALRRIDRTAAAGDPATHVTELLDAF